VSRVLFAMGRERVLPHWLGQLHPRWNTPWRAIGLDIVVWVLLAGGSLLATSRATQVTVAGGLDNGMTGGLFVFTFLAGLGTPLVMFVYLLLGLAGTRQGGRTGRRGFQLVAVLAALVGGLALFGSLYYSFVPAAPGAPIPLVTQVVPWVCLGIALVGVLVASWIRGSRPAVWADMGTVFDEV
jgi:amino acid transporter